MTKEERCKLNAEYFFLGDTDYYCDEDTSITVAEQIVEDLLCREETSIQ